MKSRSPAAYFAMPDDPLVIETSPLVDFAGLSPIPIDLPDIVARDPGTPGGFFFLPILDRGGTPPIPVSGVPEPASWALMIAGFGLAGAILRRRAGRAVAQQA